MRQYLITVDEDDERAIHEAVAWHQARDHAAFGEHLLPEGQSDTLGATLAEICRAWLDSTKDIDDEGTP